jgi:predicted AAA+ superfamily ATPase
METFERFHLQILKERIENEPKRFIQVIYGPRQVGKTTLVRQFLHQTELPWHYSSADGVAASDAVWISQQWEAARIKYRQQKQHRALLVIDEVQKVENWSEQVK